MSKTKTLTVEQSKMLILNKTLSSFSHLTRIDWEDTARALCMNPRVVENYIKGRGKIVVTATAIITHLTKNYKAIKPLSKTQLA